MTGVIAVGNISSSGENSNGDEELLALLGLATAASASGLDVYDEHMLFGAENIGSVEQLVRNALVTHSSAIQNKRAIRYEAAIRHLLDNQAICSPQNILLLVREAIREGRVAARSQSGSPANLESDANGRVEVTIDNQERK